MNSTTRRVVRAVGSALLAVGVASSVQAGPGHSAPRSGGGGAHRGGGAAPRGGGGAPRGGGHAPRAGGTAPRGSAPSHGGGTAARAAPHAHGTAHGYGNYGYGYGYGSGYGYGYGGYPYWGGWYPWWGVGWYGDWGWYGGWGWPAYGYAAYQADYADSDDTYVATDHRTPSHEPAVVETRVVPSKAEVVLDGETVGLASDYNGRWDRLRISPGAHSIVFRHEGYRSLAIQIDARPGATYTLSDTLVAGDGEDSRVLTGPAPPQGEEASAPDPQAKVTGRLRVNVQPGDAAVYLDGAYLGLGVELARVHSALAIPAGPHRLEAVRPGYVSAVRSIEVGETDLAIADVTLQPAP